MFCFLVTQKKKKRCQKACNNTKLLNKESKQVARELGLHKHPLSIT